MTILSSGFCPQPIKIFVASTAAEWLPARLLEFSIRQVSSLPVEISLIYQLGRTIPTPKAVANRPRTPFSFQRFLIPEICNYAGKAIYLDADMMVFSDIAALWNQDFAGCDLQTTHPGGNGRQGQFSVMLLDCERLRWNIEQIVIDLDKGKLDYASLMHEMRVVEKMGCDIDSGWNSLEHYDPQSTHLLHFTDMNTQPWIATTNPLGKLWVDCLRRALAANFISRDELLREIGAGHVRPSLLQQIDSGITDPLALPSAIRKLDRNFIPPYKYLQSGASTPWTGIRAALFALLRRGYYHTAIARFFR